MRATHRALLLFTGIGAGACPAAAQLDYDPTIVAGEPVSRVAEAPAFRMLRTGLREAPGPSRSGMIAALPIRENVTLGIGRFPSSAPRHRTNIEPEPRPAEIRRRDRGIAAIGVSLRF